MSKRSRKRPTAATGIAFVALFAAIGGVGVANDGDPFFLGRGNSASSQTALTAPVVDGPGLAISNQSTSPRATALQLSSAPNHPPMTVNQGSKVANLNVDKLDDFDSSAFLRRGVTTNHTASTTGGVVDVNNTGSANGVQGKTASGFASGLYGENTGGGGFGVAGRAGSLGNAIYGDNTGSGWAGYFEDKVHVGGRLDLGGPVDCTDCVGPEDIGGKVRDADKLDGIDASELLRGRGGAASQAIALLPGQTSPLGSAMFGFLRVTYSCPASLGNNGTITIGNSSPGLVNAFVDGGWSNPDFRQIAAGGSVSYPAAPNGESLHIQAQGALGVLTLDAGTVHRTNSTDCHAQALAQLTR